MQGPASGPCPTGGPRGGLLPAFSRRGPAMSILRDLIPFYISGFWQWVVLIIGIGVTGVGTFLLARWSWRWLLIVALMIVGFLFLFLFPSRKPAHLFLDESTPLVIVNY